MYTDDQIRDAVRRLFAKYDKDGSGYVDGHEVQVLLADLRKQLTEKKHLPEQEIRNWLASVDLNQDGKISLDQLFVVVRKLNP